MNYHNLRQIVQSALKEDIGKQDITTELTIPKNKLAKAVLKTQGDCVVCGLDIAKCVFKLKDKKIKFRPRVRDGEFVKNGTILAEIKGKARAILTAERVALNFLSFLSGIATKTKKYVDIVKPYEVKIMDTRKTIPGLRSLEKYAVRTGGGFNHRFRLDEMVLIKDNHLKIQNSMKKIRKKIPKGMKVEIEVKNLKEFNDALKLKPDIIMLDNMSINEMKEAVKIRNYRLPKLEASGNINLKNIRQIARSGVDMISLGTLTHSIESVDISLEIL